jgi:hypothetical protein
LASKSALSKCRRSRKAASIGWAVPYHASIAPKIKMMNPNTSAWSIVAGVVAGCQTSASSGTDSSKANTSTIKSRLADGERRTAFKVFESDCVQVTLELSAARSLGEASPREPVTHRTFAVSRARVAA